MLQPLIPFPRLSCTPRVLSSALSDRGWVRVRRHSILYSRGLTGASEFFPVGSRDRREWNPHVMINGCVIYRLEDWTPTAMDIDRSVGERIVFDGFVSYKVSSKNFGFHYEGKLGISRLWSSVNVSRFADYESSLEHGWMHLDSFVRILLQGNSTNRLS